MQNYDWRTFITNTGKTAEANASRDGDPVACMLKAATIASTFLERQVTANEIAIMFMAYSLAEASRDPLNATRYQKVIASAAHVADTSQTTQTLTPSNLRIVTDLANQIAEANANKS